MATQWTFLTNHAHVWLSLASNPELRLRDLAEVVGITERAVHRIVHELAEGGYIDIRHEGRRNHYLVHTDRPMRHRVEGLAQVGDLLTLVSPATNQPS